MQYFITSALLICIVGALEALRAEVDLNRIKLIKAEEYEDDTGRTNFHNRRSIDHPLHLASTNDYDDHSSGLLQPQTHWRLRATTTAVEPRSMLKIYEPKEDPRLFYQSDMYLKEIQAGKVNQHVAEIYPGSDVIQALGTGSRGEGHGSKPMRIVDTGYNEAFGSTQNLCVKCPAERTLIAKPGSDRVILQKPRLTNCLGRKAPKSVHFVRMFGPTFGSLVKKGSHTIVGKVVYKGQVLQHCKVEVHVITQTCPVPKYLNVQCDQQKICNFTCHSPHLELHGKSSLLCGDDLLWEDTLPVCKARTWCEYPSPPNHGRLSCIGTENDGLLSEGARCKARCYRGWRWNPRVAAICRRGFWTADLICQPRHNQQH